MQDNNHHPQHDSNSCVQKNESIQDNASCNGNWQIATENREIAALNYPNQAISKGTTKLNFTLDPNFQLSQCSKVLHKLPRNKIISSLSTCEAHWPQQRQAYEGTPSGAIVILLSWRNQQLSNCAYNPSNRKELMPDTINQKTMAKEVIDSRLVPFS